MTDDLFSDQGPIWPDDKFRYYPYYLRLDDGVVTVDCYETLKRLRSAYETGRRVGQGEEKAKRYSTHREEK